MGSNNTYKEFLSIGIDPLRVLGIAPFSRKCLRRVMLLYITGLSTLIFVLIIVKPIFQNDGIDSFIESFDSFSDFYQVLAKLITYIVFFGNIRKLLKIIENEFWPVNKFTEPIENTQNAIMLKVAKGTRVFKRFTYVTCIFMFIMPVFFRGTPYVVYEVVDFSVDKYYYPFYTLVACVYPIVPFVMGFDALFIAFMTVLLCQLIMLKYAFQSLNLIDIKDEKEEEVIYGQIKSYIRHHNLLFRFLNEIKKIYSMFLLNQFLASTISLCVTIYSVLISKNADLLHSIKYVGLAGIFLFQLFIYCVAGAFVSDANLSVADEIYKIDWWSVRYPRIHKAVSLVMVRSQRVEIISAGGLFHLNLHSFRTILKTSLSFYTLLSSLAD